MPKVSFALVLFIPPAIFSLPGLLGVSTIMYPGCTRPRACYPIPYYVLRVDPFGEAWERPFGGTLGKTGTGAHEHVYGEPRVDPTLGITCRVGCCAT